jgi:phage/conjugal plasmid C-4 type zinc finger TraR family protein
MAGGWANDGAVNDQIAGSLADEVARARARLPRGESSLVCEECGEAISPARRAALPGVRLCLACQEERDERDKDETAFSPYNRKGSKDSQLR